MPLKQNQVIQDVAVNKRSHYTAPAPRFIILRQLRGMGPWEKILSSGFEAKVEDGSDRERPSDEELMDFLSSSI